MCTCLRWLPACMHIRHSLSAGWPSKNVEFVLTYRAGKPNLPCTFYLSLLSNHHGSTLLGYATCYLTHCLTPFLFVKCLLGMLQAHHLYGDTGLTVDQPTSPGFTGASTCCLCPSCCCSRQCWPVPWHCGLDCSCCSCAEKLEKDSWLHAH